MQGMSGKKYSIQGTSWNEGPVVDFPCGFGEYDLSNPKPGDTTGGSGRGARRGGRARSGRIGCQQNCSPRKHKSFVRSKGSKECRLSVSPEARTNATLFKQLEEGNEQLTPCR